MTKTVSANPEAVLEFRATGESVHFRVYTGGCTEAEHFRLDVARRKGKAELTLVRLVPDNCKGRFPQGMKIEFAYSAVGLHRDDKIQLINPVRPNAVRQ